MTLEAFGRALGSLASRLHPGIEPAGAAVARMLQDARGASRPLTAPRAAVAAEEPRRDSAAEEGDRGEAAVAVEGATGEVLSVG
jgi:hypothetical protein